MMKYCYVFHIACLCCAVLCAVPFFFLFFLFPFTTRSEIEPTNEKPYQTKYTVTAIAVTVDLTE